MHHDLNFAASTHKFSLHKLGVRTAAHIFINFAFVGQLIDSANEENLGSMMALKLKQAVFGEYLRGPKKNGIPSFAAQAATKKRRTRFSELNAYITMAA